MLQRKIHSTNSTKFTGRIALILVIILDVFTYVDQIRDFSLPM